MCSECFNIDGAGISKIFWRLTGLKENIEFKVAALACDVLARPV